MKRFYKLASLQLLLVLNSNLFAQQTTVLPGNDNYSPQSGPQGALRTQRQFYLIRPNEMKASGLPGGTAINKIGFTIGVAQNAITKGAFKVWLKNTGDQVSRIDSSWKEVTINTNSHSARFFPGEYEVQVIPAATCPIVADTARFTFSNRNLDPCQPPTGLKTTAITATSATFNWVAPANAPTQYKISYKANDASVWTTANTSSTFFNASGLTQNKLYQWQIISDCSGDSSAITGANFTTAITSVCNPPTALTVIRLETSLTDTLAVLKWTASAGAIYYSINYRRAGTVDWINIPSFTDSLVVRHLAAGTSYEWQVKTNCPSGSGDYQTGPGFTTLGTTRCYAPYNIAVNTLTDSTAVIAWDAYTGVTSHKIRYRLKGTIPWTDAINGMTLVHNDSLTIPNQTGLDSVTFNLGSPFTYTADSGLYVAFEYSRLTGPLSSQNISVCTTVDSVLRNINGGDSIRYALSFSSRSDSGLVVQDSILTNSTYRPETILGSASLIDSVAVLAVWTLGKTVPRFQDSTLVSVQISNRSLTVDRKFGVRLTIKSKQSGALRYTKIDSLTVRAAIDTMITFREWVPAIYENDSVIVSIDPRPSENVINNNSKGFIQSVNPNILAYADGTTPITQVGFDTSPGLMLSKYTMKGCGKVIAAQVFLTSSANGHPVYAVLRNSAGTITQSFPFTPDSTSTNTYHSFYFNTPASFQNEDFYIGLAQPASATPYRPVGAQWENSVNRAGAFYKANLDGTGLVDSSGFGRLMIRAEIIPADQQPFIDSAINGRIFLCPSGTRILSAGSIEERFADSLISYSSQHPTHGYGAMEVLGTPNVYPASGIISGAWLSADPDSTRPNKHEYLELRFPNPAAVNFIDIYETANPGAVDTVWVKNSVTLNYDTVFTRIPDTTLTPAGRKYRVRFSLTPNPVSQIKISLNSGKIPGYNAIDAVAIGRMAVPAAYSGYAWTGPGIVGPSNTQAITVNAIGNYKVTVTTAAGCTPSSDSVDVVSSPGSVMVSPAGPINLCTGDSIWLKSSISGGNTWSNGSTADSIKVKTNGTYSLTNNVGCGTLTSNSVVVTVNLKPKARITGNLYICPSLSTTLDGGAGYNSYQWKNSSGTVLGTAQAQLISVAGLVKLVVDSLGCKDSTTAFVNNAPAPNPLITGNLQFCTGQSTTLSTGSFTSYEWRNGVNTTVGTSSTLNVTTADNFYVRVSNGFGCFANSPSVTTSFYPFTPPSITGDSSFCPGGNVTITASAGYSAYVWRNAANAIVGTNQSLTVNTVGTYTVTVTAANGCEGTASRIITLNPVPSPVIIGTFVFCPGGDSTTLSTGLFASYEWRNGIGTIIGTNQTVNVFSADTFIVTVTNAFGCSGTSAPIITSLLPFTPPTIAGNSAFCPGTSVTLTASTGYISYEWKNSVGTIVGTSAALIVTIPDTYTATVTDANGCMGSANKTITQAQGATPTITGSLVFCNGSSTTLSAGAGFSSYLWSPGAATTQSITVSTAGTFTVTVTNASGCTGSANAVTTVVNGVPGQPGPISGPVTGLCNTTGNVYSISPVPNTDFYIWTVPSGATIIGPQSGTSITVNYSSLFNSGLITVVANNICGPNPASNPSHLEVTAVPANPGPITGPTNGLCSLTGIVYSIAPVFAATTYTWTVPAGVTITNGQGTNSITVSFTNSFIDGSISVIVSNTCALSALSSSLAIEGVAAAPGAISGATIGDCRLENQVYSIAPVSGATSYTWTVPSRVSILEGQGTTSIKVKFDDDFVTGDICAYTNNSCGRSIYQCLTVFESPCPDFIFYPNPTSGIIKVLVKFGPYGKYNLRITNFLNQQVYKREFIWNGIDLIVDLNHLPSGIYDVTIFNDTYHQTKKMMKIH